MRPPFSLLLAIPLAAALALAARPACAQSPAEQPHPLVVSLTFEGVQNVDVSELALTLNTQGTRCRSFLLKPFCLVTNSHIFEERHYLDRQELQRDELRIRVYYWLRGWRDAATQATVTPKGAGVAVTFHVHEGPPTLVATREVTQTRPVLSQAQIAGAGIPDTGQRLDLVQLDTARVRLDGLLWDRGHADAEIRDTALVADSLHRADLQVTIAPGPLTLVDTVVIHGNDKVTERSIRRLLDLSHGQVFKRSAVLAGQRRLYQSQLFRQALVRVPDQQDSVKTILVTVEEAPLHQMRAGVGFNTTEFGQVEGHYTLYNWLGSARTLALNGAVGNLLAPQLYGQSIFGSAVPRGIGTEVDPAYLRPTWQVSTDLTQPWLFSPKLSLGLGLFTSRRSIPGIVINRGYGGTLTLTRRLADGIPLSLGYRFEETRDEAGQVYFCVDFGVCDLETMKALSGAHRLSPLTLRLQADRADDPLEPRRGYSGVLTLEHASSFTGSQFRYNRTEAEYNRYFPVGRHSTFAAHVRAGWVRPLSSTSAAVGVGGIQMAPLHPRKRFYAGGARSVRGYGENQLGPRVLTVDPQQLLAPPDTTAGTTPCTEASIADGTCDPNILPSSDFQPRPLGGNSVVEASAEYRFPITGTVLGAVFVDGARVGAPAIQLAGRARSAITPGFGIRYDSPIGPVRIDLGIRPRVSESLSVITQVPGQDGEPGLVELKTPMRYNPTAAHGGLRGVFSRLELHLAIGEAF